MTTLANQKFSKVLATFLTTGDVEVTFDKKTLLTTLNGESFTPAESQQLIKDFGSNPVFVQVMEIVNSKDVAATARKHVNDVKALQADLLGETGEDFDDIYDEEDFEDTDGEWIPITLEELFNEVGEENASKLMEVVASLKDKLEELEEGEEIEVEIPGLGSVSIGKRDIDFLEEEDEDELTLKDILATITEQLKLGSEMEDEAFHFAQSQINALPLEVKSIIKMKALATLGEVIISQAKDFGLDSEELVGIIEIVTKMLGEADRISGDNLPEPHHFLQALEAVLTEQL